MLGEQISEFKGTITVVRILPDGRTEMTIQGSGRVLGMDATLASTGVLSRSTNGVLMEEATGLVTTAEHDVAIVKITRIAVASGKKRAAEFRGTSYFTTQSDKLLRLNKIVGVSEFNTDEKGDWVLREWEWK